MIIGAIKVPFKKIAEPYPSYLLKQKILHKGKNQLITKTTKTKTVYDAVVVVVKC